MAKTKQNKKFRLNPVAVVALVLCALVAVYCGTTAWITSGSPLNPLRLVSLQDFDYVVEYTTNGGTNWTAVESSGTVELKLGNVASLENFQVRIRQIGNGVAFTRIRLFHEWKVTEDGSVMRLQSEQNMPFNINKEHFYDNRLADGCVYRKGTFDEGTDYIVINGFDSQTFDDSAISAYEDISLILSVSVDAVQFNRYSQVWGIDTLPWRS